LWPQYFLNASLFPGNTHRAGEFAASCAEFEPAEIGTTRAENDHDYATVTGRGARSGIARLRNPPGTSNVAGM
jgi:hypothetical protein